MSSIVMEDDTNNKNPIFEKLRKKVLVKELYKVGLLRNKDEWIIDVSPDKVAMITDDNKEDHYDCVEIKTRVAKENIFKVELASKNHGKVINCEFEDDVFKDCVPSINRVHVLH